MESNRHVFPNPRQPRLPIATNGGLESVANRARPSRARQPGVLGNVRPRRPYNIDLGSHLAVCDGNYLRIVRLLPALEDEQARVFRVVFGPPDAADDATAATFEVIDRDRYTTVVSVSQHSPSRGIAATRVKVRLYHDARCAEVIEFQGQRRFESVYTYPNDKMRHPDEKAQINRFLTEFLNLCLTRGVVHSEPAALTESPFG